MGEGCIRPQGFFSIRLGGTIVTVNTRKSIVVHLWRVPVTNDSEKKVDTVALRLRQLSRWVGEW